MATLVSRATGNFTSSTTWETYDSTSYLDSNAGTTAISTSNLDSATFTPGAITVTGVALKLNTRIASPTGTFTVTLRNSTGSVDVTSVTVNVSDLPYYANTGSTSLGLGWVFFKFSSPQTLLAATAYLIRCVCSSTGSQVTLWRNATSNNHCRILTTSTTAAPAASDQLIIVGEKTGAGTGNNFTVSLDNTATTSFGPTVSGGPPEGVVVSSGGTFNCTNSAATNYYFKWKGVFHITGGGVVQFGVSGTPIVSNSTLTLYTDCVASIDTGIVVDSGGTFTAQGYTKNHATTFTANAASSATVLTLASTSGWQNSDVIAIGPGNTSITEYQTSTITTVDSATQVTVSAGISAQKRGSTPHFTEVINLTRNIRFTGASTSLRGYLSYREVCTATIRYASFAHWGSSFTNQGKMGIDIQQMGAGTATMDYCAWNEGNNNQPNIMIHTSKTGSFYTNYCVAYKPGNRHVYFNGKDLANCDMLNSVVIGAVDGSSNFDFNLMGSNWKFNGTVCSGFPNNNGYGINISIGNQTAVYDLTGKFDNCRFSYIGVSGFYIGGNGSNFFSGTIDSLVSYLNAYMGVRLYSGTDLMRLTFTNGLFWGNSNTYGGAYLTSNAHTFSEYTFINCTFAGSSIAGQPRGIYNDTRFARVNLIGCSFGQVSGTFIAHTTADYDMTQTFGYHELTTNNTLFGSTNKVQTFGSNTTYDIRHQRYNGTSNDHRRDVKVNAGDSWTHRVDTTVYNTASPSEKITPTIASTTGKAKSSSFFTTVNSGSTKTINVYVRKSSSGSGDSASYTGAQPRLIQKANPALGLTTDVVLDTMTSAIGNWEQLTGTTASVTDNGIIECYVDCDGTAGFINIDDWS
jgi:hypothetical protein